MQSALGSLGEGLIRDSKVRLLVTEFSDIRARMAEGACGALRRGYWLDCDLQANLLTTIACTLGE